MTTSGEASSDGNGSSGEPPGVAYPPCMTDADPSCPEPYTTCWPPPQQGFEGNDFCTLECDDADQCAEGVTGGAVPVCEGCIWP